MIFIITTTILVIGGYFIYNIMYYEGDTQLERAINGSSHYQCIIGDRFYREGKFKKALYWYNRSAQQDNKIAQYLLGMMFYEGKGMYINNRRALDLFYKSAEQGYVHAQGILGAILLDGALVLEDYKKAFHWFMLAAKQGCALSQYNLGWMYGKGYGIEKDMNTCDYWLKKAESNGIDTKDIRKVFKL